MNLVQAVVESVESAESAETALANALAMLRTRLGWSSDTELPMEVLARFGPVALAAFRIVGPVTERSVEDVREQLAAFENWYAERWAPRSGACSKVPMPDTQRVDF